jgi:hypothetical protein
VSPIESCTSAIATVAGLRRHPGRWISAGDIVHAVARVRIGAVLHPAVLFAFTDGASLQKHGTRPSFDRAKRWPLRACHRYVSRSLAKTNPGKARSVPAS